MKETWIIYDKQTGYIDGGAGWLDREKDSKTADGSTMTERIPEIVAKKPGRAVIYLPFQKTPDPEKYKIKNGKIVELTPEDLVVTEAAKPKTEIEILKDRVAELEKKLKEKPK